MEPALRRNLCSSIADGVRFSAMVGLGESYVAAFALAVGLGEVVAGLVSALPLLAGGVLQLAAPRGVAALGSLRRWVVLCASVQGLSFAPLVVAALQGRCSVALLFAAMAVYWGAGFSAGPAWNAWMEVLVPSRLRARFFATRSRASHVATLVALLVAGGVLHVSAQREVPLLGFAGLFAAAGVARLVSSAFLARKGEAPPAPRPQGSLREVLRGRGGWLLAYMLALQLSVWLAVPYFTPFMLDHLHLSYAEFTSVTATSFLARIVSLPLIAALVRRLRADRVLLLAAVGVVPLSGLWAVSSWLPYILLLQVVGGVAWAAYELSTFLLLFDTIPRERRVALLTAYNLASAVVIVLGSLLGGGLLHWLGTDPRAYLTVFVVSSGLRLLVLPLLSAVRARPDAPTEVPELRTLAIRPGPGALQRPVLATRDTPSSDDD